MSSSITKKRVSNRDMGGLTASLVPFFNRKFSCFSRELRRFIDEPVTGLLAYSEPRGYAVFSYGDHFPIYYYDHDLNQWYGNKDKYGTTTSRHQSQAWPKGVGRDQIEWVDTRKLQNLVDKGYLKSVSERITA